VTDIVDRLQAHNHVGQCAGCLHCDSVTEIIALRRTVDRLLGYDPSEVVEEEHYDYWKEWAQ